MEATVVMILKFQKHKNPHAQENTGSKESERTYGKLPLGLPQRLDAIVMRHPRLERLGAHDPLPSLAAVNQRPLVAAAAGSAGSTILASIEGPRRNRAN